MGVDLSLVSTSPCRDTGTDVSLTSDHVGTTVPINSDPDIGAFEYLPSLPLGLGLGL